MPFTQEHWKMTNWDSLHLDVDVPQRNWDRVTWIVTKSGGPKALVPCFPWPAISNSN